MFLITPQGLCFCSLFETRDSRAEYELRSCHEWFVVHEWVLVLVGPRSSFQDLHFFGRVLPYIPFLALSSIVDIREGNVLILP